MMKYLVFRTDCEEEISWINEKLGVLAKPQSPETVAAAQSLLKKHEAFETDLAVHQDRISDVEKRGNKLIDEVCLHVKLQLYIQCLNDFIQKESTEYEIS